MIPLSTNQLDSLLSLRDEFAWLDRINMDNPSHADKLRLLRYYQGDICICGRTKHNSRWNCLDCKSNRPRELEQKLTLACQAHVQSAVQLLRESR